MLDWEELLISLCYKVCDLYENDLVWHAQRFSRNVKAHDTGFLDVEAITIYFFGIIKKKKEVKEIYDYCKDHFWGWFPQLPSYQKFNERLNWLSPALFRSAVCLMNEVEPPDWLRGTWQQLQEAVVDSMPIIMAKGSRADSAKVARDIANKGYCSSKNLWYHGVKLHNLGLCCPSKMPVPSHIVLSRASANDDTVFKEQIAPNFRNLRVFGDKIYHDEAAAAELKAMLNIEMVPCQKRKKGQKNLESDQKLMNTMVSQIRQPIESFFNWLQEKTGIQTASKVRSTTGLLKHVFGRLAAALFILIHSS
jgi:hypothetical protein